jgi:hypothetical protein
LDTGSVGNLQRIEQRLFVHVIEVATRLP